MTIKKYIKGIQSKISIGKGVDRMLDFVKDKLKKQETSSSQKPVKALPTPISEELETTNEEKLSFPSLPKEEPKQEQKEVQPDTQDVRAFEEAIMHVESGVEPSQTIDVQHTEDFSYGFFSEVEAKIKEQGHEALDPSAVLGKMKHYHFAKDDGTPFYFNIGDIKQVIEERMSSLKNLEASWYDSKKELQKIEKDLLSKEEQMGSLLGDVQDLLKKAKIAETLEEKAPEGQSFGLKTGARIGSLLELLVSLRTMTDETFYYHVNEEKHDFAAWAQGVFGKKELAERMQEARSREELINLLMEP